VRLIALGPLVWVVGCAAAAPSGPVQDAGTSAVVDATVIAPSVDLWMPDFGKGAPVGSPCTSNGQCADGSCTTVGSTMVCTRPCPPNCPAGTYCALIAGNSVCVPDVSQGCLPCSAQSECKQPSDACLRAPLGDKFCARDCTADGQCPTGYQCSSGANYGGPTDLGAGSPTRWCVPTGGDSCPCDSKRTGLARTCAMQNAYGSCKGLETCDGASGTWMGCNAAVPAPEVCDGKDQNCDGQTDNGAIASLCPGTPPPHASWACTSGMCSVGTCAAGFANYPAGNTTTGCACALEAGEPNDNCGSARAAGSLNDVGGAATISFSGTLSSNSDLDFWTFTTIDTDETTTNSYHVAVSFQQNPGNEFIMDVMRGACADAPTGGATGIIGYDWCVNASNGTIGELSCGATSAIQCGNHSATYWVRVRRRPGANGTCATYQVSATARATGCDLAQQCS